MIKFTAEINFPVGPVHFYLITYEGKNILIDTGPHTDAAKKIYLNYIDLYKLDYVFLTHIHLDHAGMLQYISENSEAKIYLSVKDTYLLEKKDEWLQHLALLFSELGFSKSFSKKMIEILSALRGFVYVPERYAILEEDDLLFNLGIDYIKAPYHSQSDVIYMIDRFAYSGDALLRDIFQTPIIDVDYSNPSTRYNNYKAFCNALYKFKNLNNYTIMPGHMDYIVSVNDTVLFYVNKMFSRLIKIKDKIMQWPLEDLAIFVAGKSLDPHIRYLKASEIIFFKDYLEGPEKLRDALTYLGIFKGVVEKYYHLSLN